MTTSPPPSGGAPSSYNPDPAKSVSVLVADAHPIVCAGVRAVLGSQPNLTVVGETGQVVEVVEYARQRDADVVVCEVAVLRHDGLVAGLHADGRKVVVLTGSEEPRTVREVLGTGVAGYVLKRSMTEQLVQAVRAVAGGGTYLDPELAGRVVAGYVGGDATPAVELSDREEQVLKMLVRGYSNKEISARLALSVKTVETYKSRSMEKLKVRTRVGLVQYAVERGWFGADVTPPSTVEHPASD